MPEPRIACVAAESEPAQRALTELEAACPHVGPDEADVIVALGGDGLMLETLHRFMNTGKPIFGMHRGSVGFLMNAFETGNLPERVARARPVELMPLLMKAHTIRSEEHTSELQSLMRTSYAVFCLKK